MEGYGRDGRGKKQREEAEPADHLGVNGAVEWNIDVFKQHTAIGIERGHVHLQKPKKLGTELGRREASAAANLDLFWYVVARADEGDSAPVTIRTMAQGESAGYALDGGRRFKCQRSSEKDTETGDGGGRCRGSGSP